MLLLDHDFGVAFGTPKYQTIASAMSELRQAYSDAAASPRRPEFAYNPMPNAFPKVMSADFVPPRPRPPPGPHERATASALPSPPYDPNGRTARWRATSSWQSCTGIPDHSPLSSPKALRLPSLTDSLTYSFIEAPRGATPRTSPLRRSTLPAWSSPPVWDELQRGLPKPHKAPPLQLYSPKVPWHANW